MKRIVHLLGCLLLSLPAAALAGDDFHGGDIHYTEPVRGVLFSHAVHVEQAGFDCDFCHDGLFAMEALAAQEDPGFTMQGLYDGAYCGACHDGSTAFDSRGSCATCHIGVKGYQRARGQAETGSH